MPKYTVEHLSDLDMEWFVETAAVNMLKDELKKPEYVDIENLYVLASTGALSGTAFVAKCDGIPVGALGGIVSPNLFNPSITIVTEVFWYVLPEYRNTRAGLLLLQAYGEACEKVADESSLSLLTTSQVNIKSIERKGYKLCENAFRREHRRT